MTREATLQHLTEYLASWRDEELGRYAVVLKEMAYSLVVPNMCSRNLHQRLSFHIEQNLNPADAGNYVTILNNTLK